MPSFRFFLLVIPNPGHETRVRLCLELTAWWAATWLKTPKSLPWPQITCSHIRRSVLVREGQCVLLPIQVLIHARYPGLPERNRKQIARWFNGRAWSPDYLFFLSDTGLVAAHALNHSVLFCEMEVRSILPVLFRINWYCFQYLRLILHFHHPDNLFSLRYLITYIRTLNSLRGSSSLPPFFFSFFSIPFFPSIIS